MLRGRREGPARPGAQETLASSGSAAGLVVIAPTQMWVNVSPLQSYLPCAHAAGVQAWHLQPPGFSLLPPTPRQLFSQSKHHTSQPPHLCPVPCTGHLELGPRASSLWRGHCLPLGPWNRTSPPHRGRVSHKGHQEVLQHSDPHPQAPPPPAGAGGPPLPVQGDALVPPHHAHPRGILSTLPAAFPHGIA